MTRCIRQMTATRAAAALALVAFGFATARPAHAAEQVWNYKSYKLSRSGGSFDRNNFVTGTITLDENGGNATLTISAGRSDTCYQGALPVQVERTDTTTVIEVPPKIPGCEHYRYVIRNDGSGGIREVKRGERWVDNRYDHDLTPKK